MNSLLKSRISPSAAATVSNASRQIDKRRSVLGVHVISAESTELFTGPPDAPLQLVRVTHTGGAAEGDGEKSDADQPRAERGKESRGEEEMIRRQEEQRVDADEIRRVEIREIAIGQEAFPREERGGGDELMLVVIERRAEGESEHRHERGGEKSDRDEARGRHSAATRVGVWRRPLVELPPS